MSNEIKVNKGTGAGGAKTNLNGINFEEKTFLGEWIQKEGYVLKQILKGTTRTQLFEVYKEDEMVAYYGRQGKVYDALKLVFPKEINNEFIKSVLSKKIYPDAFILNLKSKKLIIFEKKWQQTSGSVDEKIQTAPFKLEMFEKLTRNLNISVMYQYILSKWFVSDSYRNVKEYYKDNKQIDIWTEEENLNEFSIKKYL